MATPQPQQNSQQSTTSNPTGAVLNNLQSAMSSVTNSEPVQAIANGPIATNARNEVNQTKTEFSNLASSRQVPEHTAANGQRLTHYHSFFYTLLLWEHPRVTAISYAAIVTFIFSTRYVPLTRYALRLTWITLGISGAAELVGQLALKQGVVSKMRPKKYFTIPRETLEVALEDVEQLINFFVIEVQRIIYAENVYITIAAFLTTFITYFLIRVMPPWGLALLGTTFVYFVPLVYVLNKDLIDSNLESASNLISEQTNQVRDIASQQTNRAVEASSAAFKDYSTKAQDLIGSTKSSTVEKDVVDKDAADKISPTISNSHVGDKNLSDSTMGVGQTLPNIPKTTTDDLLASEDLKPVIQATDDAKADPLLA